MSGKKWREIDLRKTCDCLVRGRIINMYERTHETDGWWCKGKLKELHHLEDEI